MVSTLDILKKEKDLVDEINRVDRYIEIVESQLEDTKNIKLIVRHVLMILLFWRILLKITKKIGLSFSKS